MTHTICFPYSRAFIVSWEHFLFDKYSNRDYIHLKQRGDSMQRFTFDDEDDSIKDTKRENSIQQEEKNLKLKKLLRQK